MPVWLAPAVLTLYGGAFVAPYFLTRQARKVNYWHPEAEAVEYVPLEQEVRGRWGTRGYLAR